MSMTDDLKAAAFRRCIQNILAECRVRPPAVEAIVAAYTESWRTYHNQRYLVQLLQQVDQLALGDDVRLPLELLIVYHKVWYKLGRERGENERRSVAWAINDLYPGLVQTAATPEQQLTINLLQQGIGATTTYSLNAVDRDFREIVTLLLDLKRWILGQPLAAFMADIERVRQEQLIIMDDAEFTRTLSVWAQNLLAADTIYQHPRFAPLEIQARTNLITLR